MELIESAKYSIHDLSRCQSREIGEHYRLNMPFELGLDFGCQKYYGDPYTEKVILILEEQKYRYQAALSDLAGSDIEAHDGEYAIAIRKVRNWLTQLGEFEKIGSAKIVAEYEDFQEWNYEKLLEAGFSEDDIQDYPTPELLRAMQEWLDIGKP